MSGYDRLALRTFDINQVLELLGVKTEGLDRIRLARGVVGKTSYVALAAIFGLAVIAWRLTSDERALLFIAVLIGFIFFAFFVGILRFAKHNPGLALLEGAELLQWRQMEISAKEMPAAIVSDLTMPPSTESSTNA